MALPARQLDGADWLTTKEAEDVSGLKARTWLKRAQAKGQAEGWAVFAVRQAGRKAQWLIRRLVVEREYHKTRVDRIRNVESAARDEWLRDNAPPPPPLAADNETMRAAGQMGGEDTIREIEQRLAVSASREAALWVG